MLHLDAATKGKRDGLFGQVSEVWLSLRQCAQAILCLAFPAKQELNSVGFKWIISLGHLSPIGPIVLGPCQTFKVMVALDNLSLISDQFWHHVGVFLWQDAYHASKALEPLMVICNSESVFLMLSSSSLSQVSGISSHILTNSSWSIFLVKTF